MPKRAKRPRFFGAGLLDDSSFSLTSSNDGSGASSVSSSSSYCSVSEGSEDWVGGARKMLLSRLERGCEEEEAEMTGERAEMSWDG